MLTRSPYLGVGVFVKRSLGVLGIVGAHTWDIPKMRLLAQPPSLEISLMRSD